MPIRTSADERGKTSNLNTDFLHMKSTDEGYFKALFKWTASMRADRSCFEYLEKLNKERCEHAKSNALCFLSFKFIEKVLDALRQYILQGINNTINNECDGKYSIQIDTTTDRSTLQQCSVIVRYVSKRLEIKERILMFLPVLSSKGVTLFEFLEQNLKKIGLNIRNIIASCTDGAKSMTSEICGFSGLLMNIIPTHVFTWCACHRFNLVIEDSFKGNRQVQKLIASLSTFGGFIRASPKRMNNWKDIICHLSNKFKDINKRMRPAQSNTTRWWSKYRAVDHVMKTESCLIAFLISLSNLNALQNKSNWTQNQKNHISELNSFWLSNSSAINVGILFAAHRILGRMHQTMIDLETSAQPFCNMLPCISSCHQYLNSLFNDENNQLTELISQSRDFADNVIDRLRNESVQALFIEATDGSHLLMSENHEREIRKQVQRFLKSLSENVEYRFMKDFRDNEIFYKEISLFIPSNVIQINEASEISLHYLCTYYNDLDKQITETELKKFGPQFKIFLNNKKDRRANAEASFPYHDYETDNVDDTAEEVENDGDGCDDEYIPRNICTEWKILKEFFSDEKHRQMFQNVNKLYQYILTLPGTQVECERSFSILKNVKTSTRTSMSDSTLETYMMVKYSSDLLPEHVIPQLVDIVGYRSSHLRKKLIP